MAIMNSVRETEQLKDLNGLRANSAPGSPPQPIYDYTGMVGVPLAVEEAFTAFFMGVIDAVQYSPETMVKLGMHEVGKHIMYRTTMFPMLVMVVNKDAWESLPSDIQDIILNQVMPETYDFHKTNYRKGQEAEMDVIEQGVETVHWAAQDDIDAYVEFSLTHPMIKVQMLMVDPKILEIIERLRPSRQQQ